MSDCCRGAKSFFFLDISLAEAQRVVVGASLDGLLHVRAVIVLVALGRGSADQKKKRPRRTKKKINDRAVILCVCVYAFAGVCMWVGCVCVWEGGNE